MRRAWGLISAATVGLLLSACQTAPINVKSAQAVITQNETTKKHIQTFTDTNKKTQAHIKKVQDQSQKIQEESVKESDALDQVIKDLRGLLGTKP